MTNSDDFLDTVLKGREVPKEVVEYNKCLVQEYPFLLPKNVFSGKIPDDYDYSYTLMDDMPDGWRIAFGDSFLKDLKSELVKENLLDSYQVLQIKEKFGGLRWYDNGSTVNWIGNLLPNYELLSEQTCIKCGQPAEWISEGWISPYCDNCARDMFNNAINYYNGETLNTEPIFEKEFTKIEKYFDNQEQEFFKRTK